MTDNHPIFYLLVLTLTVPFLLSCTTAPPPDTTTEDLQAIKAVSEQFIDAFNRGDAASLAAFYTEEAKLLPPNSPMIVGWEGLQAHFQATFDAGAGDLQLTAIDLSVNGDMAHVVGKYTVTIQPEEGEAISDSGKYVELWKRENGSWKMNTDIWNTSAPLPVPEALPTTEEEE
ncbi:MAG: SgcJ/EcaC family oxidoreductase [Candidatus Marinimicrobia bacterium]|nr:SgcJ/EcaC family oxidoreductase [Candidatus Neomarinimicrobiota bacterium]